MKSSMETANRYLLNEEEEEIDRYVKRHGLEMVLTGTGLRYQIIKQGSDRQIEKGQTVCMEYKLHSLQGELIYSSENEGYKKFKVGEGIVESGLDEAMTHLHYGDVAKSSSRFIWRMDCMAMIAAFLSMLLWFIQLK